MGVLFAKEVEMLNVMDNKKHPGYGLGFAKSIFKKKKEWNVLKKFCNKHDIWQIHLNILFKHFLSHDEVYLRQFRIRTADCKNYFKDYSQAMRELADVMIPFIYFKEEKGLPLPEKLVDLEEVSFTRFVVTAFHFCSQPIGDCVYDFFAILRQNLKLKLKAVMYTFNLYQLMVIMLSECKKSACKDYILQRVNLKDDTEISIAVIIKLVTKYPLMFYLMERFRIHMRRQVFGDRFWKDRHILPSRLDSSALYTVVEEEDESDNPPSPDKNIKKSVTALITSGLSMKAQKVLGVPSAPNTILGEISEATSLRETARAIITDIYFSISTSVKIPLIPTKYDEEVVYVDDSLFNKLKDTIGYRNARSIVLESQLPFVGQVIDIPDVVVIEEKKVTQRDRILGFLGFAKKNAKKQEIIKKGVKSDVVPTSQFFMHLPPIIEFEERIFDPLVKADFVYNMGSGNVAFTFIWIDTVCLIILFYYYYYFL
jgi:hypothetical protein